MEPLGILIPTADTEIPVETFPFYVATQKGWIVSTPTLFGAARVLTKEAPTSLPELKESFQLNGKKLPVHILKQFHDFARKNLAKNDAECSAYITYNDSTDDYRLFIPEQYVTFTSVNHRLEAGAIGRGYRAIGTIHSHCTFSAFHSGTDKHDMGKMPGLHITIGHVDKDDPEFVFALSVGTAQFDVERAQIIDEERALDKNGYDTAPDRWLGFVKKGNAPWGANGVITAFHKPTATPVTTGYRYGNIMSGAERRHWTSWDDDDWMPNVIRQLPKKQQISQERVHELAEQQLLNIEAFEQFADFVQDSERVLEEEAIALAFVGFCLNYNIVFNTERANKFLLSKNIDPNEDFDDYADDLLPVEGEVTDVD